MTQKAYLPLLPRSKFFMHMGRSICFGIIAIVIALFIGMWGYAHFENMSWTDAFLNASMILSGMGPSDPLKTTGGKIFAGFYALFSGLGFILIIGVILAPLLHRIFHRFHLEIQDTRNSN